MLNEETSPRRELVLFLLLVALAIATRIVLFERVVVVAKDAVGFLEMARAFAAGRVGVFLAHAQHPFYPFLVVVAHLAVPGWIVAGQVVSLTMSVAALVPLYLLVRRIFGVRTALAAGLLFVFLPRFARPSADVLTEPTYVFLCLAALAAGFRAAADGDAAAAALLGLFSGLAYLTRPEGGVVFIIGASAIAVAGLPHWRGRVVAKAICLLMSAVIFAAAAGPYLVFLRCDTGRWTLSKKKSLAALVMSETAMNLALQPENGRPDVESLPAAPRDGREPTDADSVVVRLRGDLPVAALFVLSQVTQAVHPLLFLLAVVGAIWEGRRRAGELYFVAVIVISVALAFLLACRIGYVSSRHLILVGALALPWAARGIDVATKALTGLPSRSPGTPARRATVFGMILAACVVVLSFQAFKLQRHETSGYREAGRRILETFGPGKRFLYFRDGRAALYAQGTADDLALSDVRSLDALLRRAQDGSYEFLIVDLDEFDKCIPDFANSVPNYALEPVVRERKDPGASEERIVIYRFPRPPVPADAGH
ncbi:MAG: glycosyltransferase family 39 protein [Planctomycetota bacterium]